jgi:hypothetical protein
VKNRDLFLAVLEDGMFKVKLQEDYVSGEAIFAASSCSKRTEEHKGANSI